MKRSPLIRGLLLLAVLGGAFLVHRTTRIPGTLVPRAAAPHAPAAPPESTRPPPQEAVVPGEPAAAATAGSLPARTRTIRGIVGDSSGNIVPFVAVEGFALTPQNGVTRLRTESDAAGEYRLGCPEGTSVTVTAQLPGYGRTFASVDPLIIDQELNLLLRNPTSLEGVLLLAEGQPAAGATLRFHPVSTKSLGEGSEVQAVPLLRGSAPGLELLLTDCSVVTDGSGRFRADSLMGSTTYRIEVLREGRPTAVLEAYLRAQRAPMVLTLPP